MLGGTQEVSQGGRTITSPPDAPVSQQKNEEKKLISTSTSSEGGMDREGQPRERERKRKRRLLLLQSPRVSGFKDSKMDVIRIRSSEGTSVGS